MKKTDLYYVKCFCFLLFLSLFQLLSPEATWEFQPQLIDNGNHSPVIYHRDTNSNTTICQIFFRSGKSAVPVEKRGLAYLTLRMGMESPHPVDIRERYRMGSQMSWNVFGDHSVITIKCLSKHFEKTIEIFFKNFLNPFLSTIRIDLVKENMLFQRQMESDNPVRFAHLSAQSILLEPLGYRDSIYGDETSRSNIKKSQIKSHYATHISRSNMIFSISSDMKLNDIMKILTPHIIKIPQQSQNPQSSKNIILTAPEKRHYYFERDKEQTLIVFSNSVVIKHPNDFLHLLLIESLLGKGVGSKLWDLRTNKLSYHPNAQIELSSQAGLLMVFLKTQNNKKEIANHLLKNILQDLYHHGITEEELLTAKSYFVTSFVREIEDKEERSLRFAQFEALGLGYKSITNLSELLNQVSLVQFNHFIKEILDLDRMIQIIIGPEDLKKTKIQAP